MMKSFLSYLIVDWCMDSLSTSIGDSMHLVDMGMRTGRKIARIDCLIRKDNGYNSRLRTVGIGGYVKQMGSNRALIVSEWGGVRDRMVGVDYSDILSVVWA